MKRHASERDEELAALAQTLGCDTLTAHRAITLSEKIPLSPPSCTRSPEGYVYFIQQGETGPVKIGVAKDPARRVAGLQNASPVKLRLLETRWAEDAYALEGELHTRFAGHRMMGEWFQPSPELLAEIGESDEST